MGFLAWYNKRMVESLSVSAIILYLQIPHSWWALECMFGQQGILFGHNIVADFLLYGIDTLEMIPIIGVTLTLIARLKHGKDIN